jgi:phage-related baseplate assembly protein
MVDRFVSANLDLSTLPAPTLVAIDYDAIRAARLADVVARAAEIGITIDTTSLQTEPAVILEEADAYREVLTLGAINDAAKGVMLAYATGANLDNLAAFYGVQRLTITAATNDAPAVMEPDSDLRSRIILAPEQLPYAGVTAGGYSALALRVAPSVKDAHPIKRAAGQVDVVLLGRDGDGAVSSGVVSAVYAAFQDDGATQLTDIVTVRAARIVTYSPTVTLHLRPGPSADAIRAAAEANIRAYAFGRHRIGQVAYAQMITAAASVGGVELATVDIGDVDPGNDGAAYLAGLTVNAVVMQ